MAKPIEKDNSFRNIIIFSIGFLLLMAAWLTVAAIQQTVIQSIKKEDPSFTGDGYISIALVNISFSLTNFIAPMIVAFIGVRTALALGTSLYAVYIAGFMYPNVYLLYSTSLLLGLGSACVWVANGIYFTRSSTKETIGKNMGIYWVIMVFGQVIGSAFVFWKFQGMNHIDAQTRYLVILVLAGIALMSSATFIFLGPPKAKGKSDAESAAAAKEKEALGEPESPSFCSVLLEPFCLLKNKHMILLIPAAMYNGLEIAYFLAIYPTSVGFTESFGGDTRKLVGLAGIVIGVASLIAGVVFGIFGDKTVKSKRNVIMSVAFVSHVISILLMYVNLPNDAPLGPTKGTSWLEQPSVYIAMVCAFCLGVGDACVSTQIGAAIGVIWPDNPSSALAIYRFFQAATCASALYLSTLTGLYNQVLIFLVVATAGTATFCINENIITKQEKSIKCIANKPVTITGISVVNSKLSQPQIQIDEEGFVKFKY